MIIKYLPCQKKMIEKLNICLCQTFVDFYSSSSLVMWRTILNFSILKTDKGKIWCEIAFVAFLVQLPNLQKKSTQCKAFLTIRKQQAGCCCQCWLRKRPPLWKGGLLTRPVKGSCTCSFSWSPTPGRPLIASEWDCNLRDCNVKRGFNGARAHFIGGGEDPGGGDGGLRGSREDGDWGGSGS